jgi:hypothetical protein
MTLLRTDRDHRVDLVGVLDSNERRLDLLHHRGLRIVVDGPALLQFVFEQTLAHDAVQFRRRWVLNVAGLLDAVDTDPGSHHTWAMTA